MAEHSPFCDLVICTKVSFCCQPFWRLWHAPGSDGRGVKGLLFYLKSHSFIACLFKVLIVLHYLMPGVLEANFVEPAHDKQGFERTTVLSRLEARLVQMQKTYWCVLFHLHVVLFQRDRKSVV